jgi:8-oxo-dGTP pyrophosphatase MutT (NUDIX family)
MNTQDLRARLQRYRQQWPEEAGTVEAFEALLTEHDAGDADVYVRARLEGHLTASSWLVDPEGTRVLLTHHRKLDRWLQLGGHADGERDLGVVALKEAQEESGLTALALEGDLFDLDRHWIPEHRGVPGHWHYDARYVVRAPGAGEFMVSDESHALAWRNIAEVESDPAMDESLRRMARKWLAR